MAQIKDMARPAVGRLKHEHEEGGLLQGMHLGSQPETGGGFFISIAEWGQKVEPGMGAAAPAAPSFEKSSMAGGREPRSGGRRPGPIRKWEEFWKPPETAAVGVGKEVIANESRTKQEDGRLGNRSRSRWRFPRKATHPAR